jgi:DNA-binding transcriptional MerR regulator
MLVRTGKAKLSDLERAEILTTAANNGIPTEQLSESIQLDQPEEEEEEKEDSEAKDTVGELPQQLSPKSPKSERPFSPPKKEEEEITPQIEKFLKTVQKLEVEIKPLSIWSRNFRQVFYINTHIFHTFEKCLQKIFR